MEKETGVKKESKSFAWLWIVLVVIIIGAAAFWFTGGFAVAKDGGYQAVFLTNDQVYFGKLTRVESQYPILTDVYYLQVSQPLQPIEGTVPTQPNLNLVKLGNELHGPADAMRINRDHILFTENLKPDSPVVTAIEQFKTGQDGE